MDTPILFRILTILIVSILRIGIKEKKKKERAIFLIKDMLFFASN